MADPILSGDHQVYCINQSQMQRALELAREDPLSAPRIERCLRELETQLTRNERAALAFLLIDRLRRSSD